MRENLKESKQFQGPNIDIGRVAEYKNGDQCKVFKFSLIANWLYLQLFRAAGIIVKKLAKKAFLSTF